MNDSSYQSACGSRSGAGVRRCIIGVREALEAAAERHHHPGASPVHPGASDGGDGGGGVGERTGQRRGPRGDLRALPRLNGL